jgi:D-inositol-3-phosphate glycosyltransferase
VGGMPEIVEDGHNGLLVPPRNPIALAAAMERLLGDTALGRAFVAEGRKTVIEGFTQDVMVEGNIEAYRAVLADWTARRTSGGVA